MEFKVHSPADLPTRRIILEIDGKNVLSLNEKAASALSWMLDQVRHYGGERTKADYEKELRLSRGFMGDEQC